MILVSSQFLGLFGCKLDGDFLIAGKDNNLRAGEHGQRPANGSDVQGWSRGPGHATGQVMTHRRREV